MLCWIGLILIGLCGLMLFAMAARPETQPSLLWQKPVLSSCDIDAQTRPMPLVPQS